MKNILREIVFGNDKRFNGLIALTIVGLIALGCNCGKNFGDLGTKDNPPTNSSNSSTTPDSPIAKRNTSFTKADASKKEVPSDAEMQEIVKTTLLDFNDALQAGDFTDFHSRVSKFWQKQITPDRMKQTFQVFIDGRTNISAISSMDASFTSSAKIQKQAGISLLDVKGEYPTSPIKTTFELQYMPEGKEWKLFLIKVYAAIRK